MVYTFLNTVILTWKLSNRTSIKYDVIYKRKSPNFIIKKYIQMDERSHFWNTWKIIGHIFIKDLLYLDLKILSYTVLDIWYGISENMLKYNSLVSAFAGTKRHNIIYKPYKYNTDPYIGFALNFFLSCNAINTQFQYGQSKLFWMYYLFI